MGTRLKYTGIRVKDLEASIAFYTGVLGLKAGPRETIAETHGTVVDLHGPDGTFPIELNHYDRDTAFDTPYVAGEGIDHLAFQVDNLENAIATARAAGHPVVQEVRVGTKRWVYIEDPNGIWIELFE
jgi:methylmalonyl-CoA/ethylmalonyl-CoA epimerase